MTDPMVTTMQLLSRGEVDRSAAAELIEILNPRNLAISRTRRSREVAIIGVAANLPDAPNFDNFWEVLKKGKDCSRIVPEDRQELCKILDNTDPDRQYLYGSWLNGIDHFDHEFFKIPLSEAKSIDPQQRRLLEVTYHALEDAGQIARVRGTRTGVYGVADTGDYRMALPFEDHPCDHGQSGDAALTNLSRHFDLRGPTQRISCTCSSSAMAFHRASQALADDECEMALVAGVSMLSFPFSRPTLLADASGIMAEDATSRPFDNAAQGVGRGEGVIAVVLKPLEDALRDRDPIRAIVPATGANNDGLSATLTSPNPAAQSDLLTETWRKANWNPSDIDYIEAHGTGTTLGDPIEIKGIRDAVKQYTDHTQFLAVGAVKGNIGHLLDGAAGLSGIVKALLIIKHRSIPPTANLHNPSSHIDFIDSPVYIPTQLTSIQHQRELRLGVSCFGFNGTNVHVLLQSPPALPNAPDTGAALTFAVSATTLPQLQQLLALHAQDAEPHRAVDLAWTLALGREHHRYRIAIRASTVCEFRASCADLVALDQWNRPYEWLAQADCPISDTATICPPTTWLNGAAVPDTESLRSLKPRFVNAPRYPFAATSVWIEPRQTGPNLAVKES